MVKIPKDALPVKQVYNDALSPSVKQVGEMLESSLKVARFLIAPIEYVAAFQDRFQGHLKKVAKNVKKENRIEGQPQLVMPLIQGLSLQADETLLCDMFIKLLSSSIDKTKQKFAHPSFPIILSQLSRDEAVMLFYLSKGSLPFRKGYFKPEISSRTGWSIDPMTGAEITVPKFSDIEEPRLINDDFPLKKLVFPKLLEVYTDRLKNLGLVDVDMDLDEEEDPLVQIGGRMVYQNYKRVLTPFGKLFADACIPKKFKGL